MSSLRRIKALQRWLHATPCSAFLDSSTPPVEVSYVTDIEGNRDFFDRYVAESHVLSWSAAHDRLELRGGGAGGSHFVFGGDLFDRGSSDLRLARLLVDLKQRYPHNVALLLGNRDINKMRLPGELSEAALALAPEDVRAPFWDDNATTFDEYVTELAREGIQLTGAGAEDGEEELSKAKAALNTRVTRLKYILKHTMGAGDTFEYRRREIAEMGAATGAGGVEQSHVTDDDVVDSFLFHLTDRDEGLVLAYFLHAQLAHVVGDCLFVHGSVHDDSVGFLPNMDLPFCTPEQRQRPWQPTPASSSSSSASSGGDTVDVVKWVDSLNAFAREAVRDFADHPGFKFGDEARRSVDPAFLLREWGRVRFGGDALCAYQSRRAMADRTIAVAPFVVDGNLTDSVPSPRLSSSLLRSGITRVIVGHVPAGDCPLIRSAEDISSARPSGKLPAVDVVSADTGYSDGRSRGIAASEVHVRFSYGSGSPAPAALYSQASVSGVLACGTRIDFALPARCSSLGQLPAGASPPLAAFSGVTAALVGVLTSSGWHVKAMMPPVWSGIISGCAPGESVYLLSRAKSQMDVRYSLRPASCVGAEYDEAYPELTMSDRKALAAECN